ncbi:MAG: DUF3598 family protein, partial [Elainellaceae cyanobacterium]
VVDILDSRRSFTPSEDGQTVTHALDFRSRQTNAVRQKQWQVAPGQPLIVHPVDPDALLLFNDNGADVMVGGDRPHPDGFYFEPYLMAGQRRTSVVVMYGPEGDRPVRYSCFREVQEGTADPWWSENTDCTIRSVASLQLPAHTAEETVISLSELTRAQFPPHAHEWQGDFLQVEFPDGVHLVLTADRMQTPYVAALWWSLDGGARICAIAYDAAPQPEVLAV